MRLAIRMAIGQLADYARLVSPQPQKALLVPSKPRSDLLALAQSERIKVVWPEGQAYVTSDGEAIE